MPSQKNQQQAKILQNKLSKAKAFAIVSYEGTNVADQVKLRAMLKTTGAEFVVTKNTLVKLALQNDEFAEALTGMNALVFSYEDEVAGFKQVGKFHQETNKLEIKMGLIDDRVLSTEEILKLSQLPSKDELISTLIARLQGPVFGLANVLQGTQKSLLYVLKAVSEQKSVKQ